MRELLEEIQRRKDAKEDPCADCNGMGSSAPSTVCSSCLGQGVLLTSEEYQGILKIAGYLPSDFDDDRVLDQQQFS